MSVLKLYPRSFLILFRSTSILIGLILAMAIAQAKEAPPDFPANHSTVDWTWVHGAVYVPTNCTNEAQEWDQYDPAINDRELHLASIYGVNVVRVYLHYFIYLKKKDEFLKDIEDFLTRADKYKIKTEFVFFDDVWNNPDAKILQADYQYPPPLYGVHNSHWVKCPGGDVLANYDEKKASLKAYVQDVINAHKEDPRVLFWEVYNEPRKGAGVRQLMKDAQQWVHETGTTKLCTSTAREYKGGPYSDFITFHLYKLKDEHRPKTELCTESMNRRDETVPAVVKQFEGKNGYMIWELGIGRDNCRFQWDKVAKVEPATPFHGLIYPDGHPWSLDDVKVWMAAAAKLDASTSSLPNASSTGSKPFDQTPFFDVTYYKDGTFGTVAKTSVTPFIDFDLDTEKGTGSPDASAGVPDQNFSVMWKGMVHPPGAGTYTFYADCDDRVELSVNGKPVISKTEPGRNEVSGTADLSDQPVPVEIKYQHGTGAPSLHVLWSAAGGEKQLLQPTKS